jgi:outer membrane protein
MNLVRPVRLRLLTTSILLMASFAFTAKAETKIAVVDTQRAIMETEEGLRAQATLKKLFDSRQRELDKKQEQLQKEREDIEKQQGILSKEALAKRLETWQRDMSQIQSTFLEYNKELQKKQGELTQPIYQRTMSLIRRLATNEGLDLVIDRQAAPYVRGDLDVTDKIIQMVNSGGGASESDTSKSGKAPDTKKSSKEAPKLPAPAKP